MSEYKQKIKLIVIAGPTGSGKTNISLKLAKNLNGELINADSRQIYRFMDIGTNKGTISPSNLVQATSVGIADSYNVENTNVNGWLFDLVDPGVAYSLANFKEDAEAVIDNILHRGKFPFLVGGTGLYIDALVRNYKIDSEPDAELRIELNRLSLDELQVKLAKEQPGVLDLMNNSDRHNPRRIIRLLEGGGNAGSDESKYETFFIYPQISKEELYKKINNRVDLMLKAGLIEETEKLIKDGYGESEQLRGIGYKQVIAYLNKMISKEQMTEEIKQAHRNYAKRQVTWFESGGRGYALNYYDFSSEIDKMNNDIQNFIKE